MTFGNSNSESGTADSVFLAELREIQRHPVSMELRFSYRRDNVTYMGTGRTKNLTSEAVCFEMDQTLSGKPDLELRIPWPARLQSVCDLELVVRGHLVRQQADVAVLLMESCEFQTHGDRSFSELASCGVTCNLAA